MTIFEKLPCYSRIYANILTAIPNITDIIEMIAEAEKAILDYFYLNPQLHSPKDMEYLRFDLESLNLSVSKEKLSDYLERLKVQL
ncbi:MAG TPA: hypothetical protein ENN84_07935 [Candidatus Marinimicrobia bacterium]|nr:hypothetical protein [Candidatus Neomarinimicrobiota bacterium]